MMHLLWVIGVVLLVLWALGLITSNSFSGGIHFLLVVAVVLFVVWFLVGRV